MTSEGPRRYIFDTTIPYVDFNYRKYSTKATLLAYVFAQSMEEIDQFLFYLRGIHHYFEPIGASVMDGFLEQVSTEDREALKEDIQGIFNWQRQERLVSELILARIVDSYVFYLIGMADHIVRRTARSSSTESFAPRRTFPQTKEYFRKEIGVPLYLTPADERLADQIVTMRNILVHNVSVIPDKYLARFANWQELQCIRQDSDLLIIQMNFSCVDQLGNFLSKSVADIDSRAASQFKLEQHLFDEDMPAKPSLDPYLIDGDML